MPILSRCRGWQRATKVETGEKAGKGRIEGANLVLREGAELASRAGGFNCPQVWYCPTLLWKDGAGGA
jgi:hypothetical protein